MKHPRTIFRHLNITEPQSILSWKGLTWITKSNSQLCTEQPQKSHVSDHCPNLSMNSGRLGACYTIIPHTKYDMFRWRNHQSTFTQKTQLITLQQRSFQSRILKQAAASHCKCVILTHRPAVPSWLPQLPKILIAERKYSINTLGGTCWNLGKLSFTE